VNFLFRSLSSTVRCLRLAVMPTFCVKVVELSVGFVEEGRLDETQASLGVNGHHWRVKIQDLESLGRDL
jgi:hypothetical protein